MKPNPHLSRAGLWLAVWTVLTAACFAAEGLYPAILPLASGITLLSLAGLMCAVLALSELLAFCTHWSLARRNKPPAEGVMIARLYRLLAFLGLAGCLVYGMDRLSAFVGFFSMFGGMLLGFSLQAPVSGFAAWVLVSCLRPFRPGDRVQFPNLGLTGDVKEIGAMYTVLDQVGGSIGSEEAVGRDILVPNAMLFSQVAINYTVTHEAAFMLDEVVVRITYDSNWDKAEKILLDAARKETATAIAATGMQPYIRSDMYDYGVYLRLRYQTRVQDRAETAYRINKVIFEEIQRIPEVDIAIPYVYSFRSGTDRKEEGPPPGAAHARDADARDAQARDADARAIQELEIDRIDLNERVGTPEDVAQVAASITARGLLQPIVVCRKPQGGRYEILAGHLRFEACRNLGWKTVPAIVRETSHRTVPTE